MHITAISNTHSYTIHPHDTDNALATSSSSASCSLCSLLAVLPRNAAASNVQHRLRAAFFAYPHLRLLKLSYNPNTTCAAGATNAPSTGRKPGIAALYLYLARWANRETARLAQHMKP